MDARSPAFLLIAGAAVFFGLGFGIAAARRDLASTGQGAAQLPMIARHVRAWRGIPAAFGIAIVLTGLGFGASAWWLRDTAAGIPAMGATLLYLLGTSAMLPSLAFQWGPKVSAAKEQSRSNVPPEWFAPLELWSENLYGLYMLLAYAAIALLGASFALATAAPTWLGLLSIAFGSLGALSFAARSPKVGELVISDLPLWIHVWAIVAGVGLYFA